MKKVRNILEKKNTDIVFSVPPTATVFSAIELMSEKNIGGVVVIENGNLVGIFTERDYARKLILKGKSSRDTPIGELMTKNLITVTPESTIQEAMQLMSNKKIRHLPVLEAGKLCGIISISDVVRFIMEEQKEIIEHLEHYITRG
jgi:CBS domain-containing protein